MGNSRRKYTVLIGAGVVVAIGIFGLASYGPAGLKSAVLGAIGKRDVYRDSNGASGADASSNAEFAKLYAIGQFKALASDPKFKALASDADFTQLLGNNQFVSLMGNTQFTNLIASQFLSNTSSNTSNAVLSSANGATSSNVEASRRPQSQQSREPRTSRRT